MSLQLQDPTALPGLAGRHRKYLEKTLESLDHYSRKLLFTTHPCARNGLCSSYTFADVIIELEPSRKGLMSLVGDVDAIMFDMTPVDAELLKSAPRPKAIIEYSVGTDHIDCETIASQGIVVSNAPEAFSTDVADHAIALLFLLTRQVAVVNDNVRHKFQWDTYGPASAPTRLLGKTLGIVGIGRIGQETARIAAGIGMNVSAYDPFVNSEKFNGPSGVGIHFCPNLDALLTRADEASPDISLTGNSAG